MCCAVVALAVSTVEGFATPIDVDWNGGTGNWNAAANWTPAVVPNNSGPTTYRARIDNGKTTTTSTVALDTNATVDGLVVDSGDTLNVNAGRTLKVNGGTGIGVIDNNGSINLLASSSSSAAGTLSLGGTGAVSLSGSGALTLNSSATATSSINSAVSGATLTNGLGHTIQGAGFVDGGSGGTGTPSLALSNAGLVQANANGQPLSLTTAITNTGTLRASNGGTLTINNGFNNGSIANSGGLIEAKDGSTVNLIATTVKGGELSTSGSGVISLGNSSFSVVSLDGASSGALTNSGALKASNATTIHLAGSIVNNGTMDFTSGGTIFLEGDTALSGNGKLTMSSPIQSLSSAGVTLTNGAGHTIQGAGLIDGGTGGTAGYSIALGNQGTIAANVTGDVLSISTAHNALQNSGILLAAAGSTLEIKNGYVQTAGSTIVNGTLNSDGLIELQGGKLGGSGVINGNVTVSLGVLVGPGNSPGKLTINGNYQQSSADELQIQIGGIHPGTDYDQLIVTGAAMLSGMLDIELLAGFVPDVGSEFDVVTYASRSGMFTQLAGLNIGFGRHFDVSYLADHIALFVVADSTSGVPEPGSFVLLLGGLGWLALGRRRSR